MITSRAYRFLVLALASNYFILLISNHQLGVSGLQIKVRGQSTDSEENDDEKTRNGNQHDFSIDDNVHSGLTDAMVGFEGMAAYQIIQNQFQSGSGGRRSNHILETFFADTSSATRNTNTTTASARLIEDIKARANGIYDFLLYSRRFLHKHPELMYTEDITSAYVQKVLRDLDIKFTKGWAVNTNPDVIHGAGGYGVVADIGTGEPPCVLLRADMDALPIFERTENIGDFRSRDDGKMHACGHDGHTTMLLGAASLLKSMEDSINGTVRLMFQPAEEGGAGGKRMREEGVLTMHPAVQHAFGQHLWPTIPSGTVASRPGTVLAAAEMFEILVSGVGGHAAMPHLTIDPIVAASSIVMNLQTIVSRRLSPLESGVVSVTKFEAGDAFNVIPNAALLRGTIRALTTETLLSLKDRVQFIVDSTAAVHDCNVTITYSPDFYPPTVNDPALFETFSRDVGGLVAEDHKLTYVEPTMGGEDFSFLSEEIPSTFFLLGQGSGKSPETFFGLHHPHFAMDESVLPRGVELLVNVALRALHKLADE